MRHARAALGALGVIAGLVVAVSPSAAGQEARKPAAAAKAASAQAGPAQPIRPVTDISMNSVFADGCRLWIEVKNTGNVTIDKVLRERVWVDGVVKDQTQMHYVLKPGATFSHGVGADPGVKIAGFNRTVKAMIDAENVLAESNEANNDKQVTLSCKLASAAQPGAAGALQAMPDLTCPQANIFFEPAGESRHYYIKVTVLNGIHDGTGHDAAPFRVRATYEDRTVNPWATRTAVFTVAGLGMGLTHVEDHISIGVHPQQAYFRLEKVEVDIDRAVSESNEGNNTKVF